MRTATRIAPAESIPGDTLTLEAFLAIPLGPPYYELVDGTLILMATPTPRHQAIIINLIGLLLPFIRRNSLGSLFPSPLDVVLDTGNVFIPDLLFVSTERASRIGEKRIEGAPDLVVEVLSPSTTRHDREVKLPVYAQAGVRELWLIDPEARRMTRHDNQDGAWHITATLSESSAPLTSAVLVGLEIGFGEVFGG
jgi:Uma2 family endonuclease